MERYVFLRRVFYFIELLDSKKTGSRRELAARFDMSDSGVKRMINDLRDAGLEINYDPVSKSYVRVEKHSENSRRFRQAHVEY